MNYRYQALWLAAAAFMAMSVAPLPTEAKGRKKRNFVAHLNGRNQVPEPVATRAQGQAFFQLSKEGDAIRYKLIVANIRDVFMAHIHLGDASTNGPIAVWLYPSSPPSQLIEGRFDGVLAEGTFDEDDIVAEGVTLGHLIRLMRRGDAYVNVHTLANRPGEIRGQIK